MTLAILARDGQGRPADIGEAYQWFLIAAQQGGPKAQELAKNDLAVAKAKLDEAGRSAAETGVASWLLQHPHQDLYKVPGGLRADYYPMDEVYLSDIAALQLSKEANPN